MTKPIGEEEVKPKETPKSKETKKAETPKESITPKDNFFGYSYTTTIDFNDRSVIDMLNEGCKELNKLIDALNRNMNKL